ncbi:MAG: NAD+ synthase [Chloroflexi bacterium]|nr:NAD+ synthase [Chloroflexota bacterium]
MRICLAQMNSTIGDLNGNLALMRAVLEQSVESNPDLVVFPELCLTGYPPRDLLKRKWFIRQNEKVVLEAIKLTNDFPGVAILFGAPLSAERPGGKGLQNAALLAYEGKLIASTSKRALPGYDLFNQERYFDACDKTEVVPFKGQRLGILLSEDILTDSAYRKAPELLPPLPADDLVEQGATVLICLAALPYQLGQEARRMAHLSAMAKRLKVPIVLANAVGANDETIFEGKSCCLSAEGEPQLLLPGWQSAQGTIDLNASMRAAPLQPEEDVAALCQALVLGIRDYARKTGFKRIVLGLSGGIDSALSCCLAAQALGAENVLALALPSAVSTAGSLSDAQLVAAALGVQLKTIPIAPIVTALEQALEPILAGTKPDTTEENIQSRVRGVLWMAVSNKFGHLVLANGNKSELLVGYCTLYGDMAGGLAPLADVPKTLVYALAEYINRERIVIPTSVILKPPSAELRPNQTDQDTLPSYDILDPILELMVEEGKTLEEITARGYEAETVRWVARAVARTEFKRRQAAPMLRVTSSPLGIGKQMPLTTYSSI